MKLLRKSIFIIIFGLNAHLAIASGQRTAVLTMESINTFHELKLENNPLPEKTLHYIGTVNNKTHILMITKTSYSENSDGSIGRPWNHVFKYKISVDNMTIMNGWDLTDKLKHGGLNISPSYCPRLYLSSDQKKYVLPEIKKIKSACLE